MIVRLILAAAVDFFAGGRRRWVACGRLFGAAVLVWLPFAFAGPAAAQTRPVTVAVDAREAPRGILHVRETIPAVPGPLTLAYPKWIPGEHAPNGPIANLATLVIAANGTPLTWRRDPVELTTFTVDVPAGVASLDVSFDFLGSAAGQYSSARLGSPNILVLTWNKVLLTPAVADYRTLQVAASLQLPGADWQIGTALDIQSRDGANLAFKPVSEETLVDSPLDAAVNAKTFALGRLDGAPVELDVFADSPAELNATDATIAKFRNLVREMQALYHARHFRHYAFLLTVSDVLPGEGVEHHESSDDGSDGDFLTDAASFESDGDLLPHEFNHSWNGKYRRPAGLATLNLQAPMHDDLLWVYEGMTQFYGELQAERSGIWTKAQWFDELADSYAELDSTTGRATRPLLDTAVAGPFLYGAGRSWSSARRSVDFYSEGALIWLEADGVIRRLSHGRRSIDDFARAFFGRTDSEPQVITYTREDIVAALNAVQAYDWQTFFVQRVDTLTAHPPDPFTPAGWRVVYAPAPSAFAKLRASHHKSLDARYSLGIVGRSDGRIVDVINGSPAARAGLGPQMKIVAIGDRAIQGDAQAQLDAALRDAQRSGTVKLLIVGGDVYRDVSIAYRDGPRFPHLERIPGSVDRLSSIAAARRGR